MQVGGSASDSTPTISARLSPSHYPRISSVRTCSWHLRRSSARAAARPAMPLRRDRSARRETARPSLASRAALSAEQSLTARGSLSANEEERVHVLPIRRDSAPFPPSSLSPCPDRHARFPPRA